ncbi:HlyD family efflux transporter periplasmic adaptor subunit [Roseofilum casamattae]|uniref:HlyD family efflux transporter periplasmic adaptor subunit n=1 Tax=Roseofilum casamattae BLCC-M143 TaxID=3022442 RepID=A0ABT7BRT7_9CYAN|nr:HlyD family efflux transporter periplasmic adaptor subunit [Roseofilum casamattae]MDJ1181906.1 HlyD family efflux transporter periplasmic adaptor subunit [Roseofilum casamattae BLCC-M143]
MSVPSKEQQSRWNGWTIAGSLLVLGLLGAGLFKLSEVQSTQPDPALTADVNIPSEPKTISALGRLSPQGEVIQVSGPQGDRIAELLVEEGESVKIGQILAYLESHAERKVERDLAARELANARAQWVAQTQFGEAQIAAAQTKVQEIDEPQTFEIEAQQATIRRLQAELKLAETDRNRFEQLYQEGAIAKQQLDRQRTQVEEITEQIRNARSILTQLETGRETRLNSAIAELESTRANLPLAQARIAVEPLQQQLNLAETRLDRTIIRAPGPGTVLHVRAKPGEAIGSAGILDLGNVEQMYAIAEVYETDIGLVQPGQSATVVSRHNAFTETLTGTVDDIGWQIFKNDVFDDDPAALVDARVVEVKIKLDESESVKRLTNLQVDVRINLE